MSHSRRAFAASLALALAAAGGLAAPALAQHPAADRSNGRAADLMATTPAQLVDEAQQALRAGDVAAASARLDAAQDHLLRLSTATRLPGGTDPGAIRGAMPLIDQARQALTRGDTARATTVLQSARALL